MSKKVIYSGFDVKTQGVVDFMQKNYAWEPVFFNSTKYTKEWAKKVYPNVVHCNEIDLRKSKFDYSEIGLEVPIDANILSKLSQYELSCFSLMQDATGWNFSFSERRRYYYDVLKYWNTVISNLKPDIFIAFNWPHVITSYTLYLLCKYQYKIDVLFLDPIPHLNRNCHVIGTSLEDFSMPFYRLYESENTLEVSEDVKKYLQKLRDKKHDIGEHNVEDMNIWKKRKGFQLKELVRILAKGIVFQESDAVWKKNKQPYASSKSKLTCFSHFWFLDRLRRKDMALKKIYALFSVKPDFTKKYLYFAAALQPEVTSDLFGGVYADQMLALEILSVSIPEDWVIYYKEHPATFSPMMKASLRKNYHFYEKLSSLKKVKLIPSDIDPFKLIDCSQIVASIAGSSNWEAVIRGKPGLFFGNVWYQGCKSLFRIESLQDCQEVIKEIIDGSYLVDQKDIERYLAAIERVGIKDLNYRQLIRREAPSGTLERISKGFYEAYQRYYVGVG